jgi:hypothetical protein
MDTDAYRAKYPKLPTFAVQSAILIDLKTLLEAGGIAPLSAWIPVSERLPELDEEVLCYCLVDDDEFICVSRRDDAPDQYWHEQFAVATDNGGKVTHWQPLPAPPSPPPTEPVL